MLDNLCETRGSQFTYEELVEGISDRTFKRIAIMTGANASLGAGIPDFRNLTRAHLDGVTSIELPFKDALFNQQYFVKNP